MNEDEFKQLVWDFFKEHKRSMPWRENTEAYWVFVSEVMLQQTQVDRVIPKFETFVAELPDFKALAEAPFAVVMRLWSGLGYNRRAKFLQRGARIIVNEYSGELPQESEKLERLPGIGPNTAAAIIVYTYNQPLVFVETNIRTVFLHHFFGDVTAVDDRDIRPLIERTLDKENPREWYWALMDYGAWLKRELPNPSRASKHHSVQSRFEGSRRQIRGRVLKLLLDGPLPRSKLERQLADTRSTSVINDLIKEGMVAENKGYVALV